MSADVSNELLYGVLQKMQGPLSTMTLKLGDIEGGWPPWRRRRRVCRCGSRRRRWWSRARTSGSIASIIGWIASRRGSDWWTPDGRRPHIPDEAETRARWGSFAWTDANAEKVKEIIGRYPPGREHSAIMPLLWLAQAQVGAETQTYGWLPIPVIEYVAKAVNMPYIRALEVVSFYTQYNMAPVGRYLVQVCGTTPCMLRGSDDVMAACKNKGLVKGRTTPDGLFTLVEVECLGACANAPMVQINDDNYEDLTFDSMAAILETLAAGGTPKPGPQNGRTASCPEGGPTTLTEMARENHDYRDRWTAGAKAGAGA